MKAPPLANLALRADARAALNGLVAFERARGTVFGHWGFADAGAPAAAVALLYFRRADLPLMNRGDAAATTWIVRGERVRGYDVSAETSPRRRRR